MKNIFLIQCLFSFRGSALTYFSFILLCLPVLATETSDVQVQEEQKTPFEILQESLTDQETAERKIRAFDKINVLKAELLKEEARDLNAAGKDEDASKRREEAKALLAVVDDAYQLGLSLYGDSAVLHNFYGEFLFDIASQVSKAVSHWQKALRADENCARAHNNLGMYDLHQGAYESGLSHMDKALALEPDNPTFLFNIIQIYLTNYRQVMALTGMSRAEVFEKAMNLSARSVALAPHDYQILRDYALNFFLAEDFESLPDWTKAASAWHAAGKHAPNKMEQYNTLLYEARAHIRGDNKTEAQRCLLEADKLLPNNALVQELLLKVKQ
ncbi:MAG: hypothetical protein GX117_10950 [Candidatus Hydrogenedentes bacterium]|nr:hypothetical protein [Candidatus Hydrogenedentota bacterium]